MKQTEEIIMNHRNIGIDKDIWRNEPRNLGNKAIEKCVTRNQPL